MGRGWRSYSPRIVQRRRYKEPKWPDNGQKEVEDKNCPSRLRGATLCWWGCNQHDVVQSPSELRIKAAESKDPMPGPTAQRNKDKSRKWSPQARKTRGAGITYLHTRMGLNGEALQARSSMSFVMLTLNHDDVSKNLIWYLLKIAKEALQDSKQTSQKLSTIRIRPAKQEKCSERLCPPPPKP